MFGIGGSEILVILVVALLFLGPDKLPDAAKTISKGIRDLKKQSRALQNQIESDEQIGGAIRDLKSALRGDDFPARPPVRREPPKLSDAAVAVDEVVGANAAPSLPPAADVAAPAAAVALAAPSAEAVATAPVAAAPEATSKPVTLPLSAGEPDPDVADEINADELGHLIKPAPGTVAKNNG